MAINIINTIKAFLILFFIILLKNYKSSAQDKIKVNGYITNIFYETVDSVMVIIKNPDSKDIISSCYTNKDGYFTFDIDKNYYNNNLMLICTKIDYRYYETLIKLDSTYINLNTIVR